MSHLRRIFEKRFKPLSLLFLVLIVFHTELSFSAPRIYLPSCKEALSYVAYVVHNNVALLGSRDGVPPEWELHERYWQGRNIQNDPWLNFLVNHGVIIKRKTFFKPDEWRSWEEDIRLQAGPRTKKTATAALSAAMGKTPDGEARFKYARIYEKPNGERVIIDIDQPVPEGLSPHISNKTTENSSTEFVSIEDQNFLLARRRFFLANDTFFYHDLAHGVAFREDPPFYEAMVKASQDLEVPGEGGKSVFHDDIKSKYPKDVMQALDSRYFYVMELSHKLDNKYAPKLEAALKETGNLAAVKNPSEFKPQELRKLLTDKFSDKQLQAELDRLTKIYDKFSVKTGGASVDGSNVAPVLMQGSTAGAAFANRMSNSKPFEYSYDRASMINRIILMQGELVLSLHYPPEVQAGAMLVPDRFSWLGSAQSREIEAASFFKRLFDEDPDAFRVFNGWHRP